MIATYTEARKSPITFEQAREALKWAMQSARGSAVSNEALALGMAKTALETGRWQKMWLWNWGNIKASPAYEGMWQAFGCGEELRDGSWLFTPDGWETCVAGPSKGIKRQPVVYQGPPVDDWHPQTRFRAYANHFDGADQYMTFLMGGRYRKACDLMLAGDAPGYVHALKQAGYFTADEGQYLKGVAALQREFLARLRGFPKPEVLISDDLYAQVEQLQSLWWASVLMPDGDGPVANV